MFGIDQEITVLRADPSIDLEGRNTGGFAEVGTVLGRIGVKKVAVQADAGWTFMEMAYATVDPSSVGENGLRDGDRVSHTDRSGTRQWRVEGVIDTGCTLRCALKREDR